MFETATGQPEANASSGGMFVGPKNVGMTMGREIIGSDAAAIDYEITFGAPQPVIADLRQSKYGTRRGPLVEQSFIGLKAGRWWIGHVQPRIVKLHN